MEINSKMQNTILFKNYDFGGQIMHHHMQSNLM